MASRALLVSDAEAGKVSAAALATCPVAGDELAGAARGGAASHTGTPSLPTRAYFAVAGGACSRPTKMTQFRPEICGWVPLAPQPARASHRKRTSVPPIGLNPSRFSSSVYTPFSP